LEVYFDNSATTKPYREVVEAVAETMENCYGNPSSAHKLGLEAERKLNWSRDIISKTINCGSDEVIFTSGGSESNNFLIRGFIKEGAHIITSSIEHPSVLNTCSELYNKGYKITYLKVDCRGKIDLNELANSIDKDTQLISIMHVIYCIFNLEFSNINAASFPDVNESAGAQPSEGFTQSRPADFKLGI
jgi:cysteine desulfurase